MRSANISSTCPGKKKSHNTQPTSKSCHQQTSSHIHQTSTKICQPLKAAVAFSPTWVWFQTQVNISDESTSYVSNVPSHQHISIFQGTRHGQAPIEIDQYLLVPLPLHNSGSKSFGLRKCTSTNKKHGKKKHGKRTLFTWIQKKPCGAKQGCQYFTWIPGSLLLRDP